MESGDAGGVHAAQSSQPCGEGHTARKCYPFEMPQIQFAGSSRLRHSHGLRGSVGEAARQERNARPIELHSDSARSRRSARLRPPVRGESLQVDWLLVPTKSARHGRRMRRRHRFSRRWLCRIHRDPPIDFPALIIGKSGPGSGITMASRHPMVPVRETIPASVISSGRGVDPALHFLGISRVEPGTRTPHG